MLHTLSVVSENKPGVLYRIADLFLRRKINIESLTVGKTGRPDISSFTICVDVAEEVVGKIMKQVEKIIEVMEVHHDTEIDWLVKEVVFIKIPFAKIAQTNKIQDQAKKLHAELVFIGEGFVILEKTGKEEDIVHFIQTFEPFGIAEIVRSGKVSIRKRHDLDTITS